VTDRLRLAALKITDVGFAFLPAMVEQKPWPFVS